MKKLSFALAFIMLLGCFSLFSFAVEDPAYEARVGNLNYENFEDAVSYAAKNGGTVEVLKDVSISSEDGINLGSKDNLKPTHDFTINGNGFMISSTINTAYRATLYVGQKTVTIKNLVFETTTSNANAWGAIAVRYDGSHVILEDCTVNVNGSAGACAIGMNAYGKVTLKNTTVTTDFNAFLDYANNGEVVAEGTASVNALILGIAPVSGLTQHTSGITMKEGAAVRLNESTNGIRFVSEIKADTIAKLESLKDSGVIDDYGYGTLICKNAVLDGIDFTLEALETAGKGSESFANVPAQNGMVTNEETGDVTIYSALVNIKISHYDTEFAAISYIEYRLANGATYRAYATFDPIDNVRTIKNVSYEALSDIKASQNEEYSNQVTSYYMKNQNGYTLTEGIAYSPYNESERKILQNYIDEVLNHDPNAPVPLTESISVISEHTSDVFLPIGRTYIRNNGLACDFTCTGIKFNAYCEGNISVELNTSAETYFTVYVDGVRQDTRIKANSSSKWVNMVSGLTRGDHEIMIVKQSQFTMATTELNQVKITGKFKNELPKEKELFIEFYGDSILNGSNIFLGGTSAKTSDGTQAFGWLTAQNLNADCNIIGCGGLGLSVSGSNFVMDDVWDLNGSLNKSGVTKYDFARTPDAVVIELGVNDEARASKTTVEKYKQAVKEFVLNVQEAYGNDITIVWVYGYHDKAYWEHTKDVLDNLEHNDNIHYCELTQSYISKADGGDGYHPDVDTSKVMAEELTAFLNTFL